MDAVSLLRLLQLFDSQFPVGAFAHSGGLETYAAAGAALPQLREQMAINAHRHAARALNAPVNFRELMQRIGSLV